MSKLAAVAAGSGRLNLERAAATLAVPTLLSVRNFFQVLWLVNNKYFFFNVKMKFIMKTVQRSKQHAFNHSLVS